jgi:flap endonuclease-1
LKKKKLELQSHRPNSENIGQCKEMFEKFGVNIIQAPAEADGLLAQLVIENYVDAVISTDTDQFAFGAGVLLIPEKDITELTRFDIQDVYDHVDLKQSEFVDFCILCGCDYLKRIYGIGVVTALKYIKKYKTIENVLDNLPKKFKVPNDYLKNVEIARTMFVCNPDGTIPNGITKESIEWKFDKKLSKKWLKENHPSVYKIYKNSLFSAGVQTDLNKFLIQNDDVKTTSKS